MRKLLAHIAAEIRGNQLLDKDKGHVEGFRISINAFSSLFEPNSIHTACLGKLFEVLGVVYGYKERIVLHINLRVGGNFPDALFRLVLYI